MIILSSSEKVSIKEKIAIHAEFKHHNKKQRKHIKHVTSYPLYNNKNKEFKIG